ncbi:porin [Candidatus Parcubacteria bacterium]|nr:MAG: porin [Candidatus Parcubacteria bacterium]
MKKQIIAVAIAAAVAAPAAMAGAPTVYGQINMSIDSVTDKGVTVNSNASRIGVKGAEDLGNGLKAIYKMEWGVDVAGGNGATAKEKLGARNAYVGLAGGFGAVLLGRHDTPTKIAQPTDMFNDGLGDLKPMSGGLGILGAAGEIRAANVVAYVSPSFNGIKLIAAGVSPDAFGKNTNLANAYSIAVMYGSKKKGLYLSGGYDSFDKHVTGAKTFTEYRLAAQYTMGDLMGNIMYANYDDGQSTDSANEGSNWQVNVAYTIGAATLKGKYSSVNYKPSGMKDAAGLGLGVDYALGKKTTAYVEYVNYDKHMTGTKSVDNISVGLIHKF